MSPKNNPEPPVSKISGHTALPMSRIKKIIQLDDDIVQCSNNATFAIAVATEMFIQYLVQQGHNVVKSERKPRKNIQYRDLATAVSRIDNLEFLADVIPKTTTYKLFKQKKAKDACSGGAEVEKGQRTLNGDTMSGSSTNSRGPNQDPRRLEVNRPSISVLVNPHPQNPDGRTENQPDQQDSDVDMVN